MGSQQTTCICLLAIWYLCLKLCPAIPQSTNPPVLGRGHLPSCKREERKELGGRGRGCKTLFLKQTLNKFCRFESPAFICMSVPSLLGVFHDINWIGSSLYLSVLLKIMFSPILLICYLTYSSAFQLQNVMFYFILPIFVVNTQNKNNILLIILVGYWEGEKNMNAERYEVSTQLKWSLVSSSPCNLSFCAKISTLQKGEVG